LAGTDRVNDGELAEGFSLGDVRDVNLHDRDLAGIDGIAQRIAVVGQGTGIEQDTRIMHVGGLDQVNQFAFVIGLETVEGIPHGMGGLPGAGFDFGKGECAILGRVASAQQIEIRSID